MQRDVERRGVGVEDLLRPIAVVVIQVKDRNRPTVQKGAGCGGRIVEVAEPAILIRRRVMSWRATESIGGTRSPLNKRGGGHGHLHTPVGGLPSACQNGIFVVVRVVIPQRRETIRSMGETSGVNTCAIRQKWTWRAPIRCILRIRRSEVVNVVSRVHSANRQ